MRNWATSETEDAVHGKVYRFDSSTSLSSSSFCPRYGENPGYLPDLVTPRQHHGCSSFLTDQGEEVPVSKSCPISRLVYFEQAILVAGGSVEGSEGWIPISSTELFLPSTNRWTKVGSLPR